MSQIDREMSNRDRRLTPLNSFVTYAKHDSIWAQLDRVFPLIFARSCATRKT